VSIRDLFDQGQPDPAHPATAWGAAISDKADRPHDGVVSHPLTIPTYDGGLSVTHPDVVFVPEGLHGWRYWMAFTPFPDGGRENPSIVVSQNGVDWQVPSGLTNPVVSLQHALDNGAAYNSDTDLVLMPDGVTLRMYWRHNTERIWFVESSDGINWTPEANATQVIFAEAGDPRVLSPAVVVEPDGTFTMWSINSQYGVGDGRSLERRTSSNGVTFNAKAATVNPGYESGAPRLWHVDVIRAGDGRYYALVATRSPYRLLFWESDDGIEWEGRNDYLPTFYPYESGGHYRSTLVARPGYPVRFDVWQATYGSGASPTLPWRIGLLRDVPLLRWRDPQRYTQASAPLFPREGDVWVSTFDWKVRVWDGNDWQGEALPPPTVPDAPTIGTATAGDAQATVEFTPPANDGGAAITGYTALSSPGGLTGTGPSSPVTVEGLTNGTPYTFTVVATNSVGDSAPSDPSNEVTPEAASNPPSSPTDLSATGGDGQVSLEWAPSAGATGHRVYRNTADNFAGATQVGTDLGAGAGSYLDETVTNDTAYFYWVTAFNAVGESDPSVGATATPTAGPEPGELPVTAGLFLRFDATQLSGLSDLDPVAVWTDVSGNGRDASQPTPESRPVYAASELNGLPVVQFSGSSHLKTASWAALAQPNTFFAVCRGLYNNPNTYVCDGLTTSDRHAIFQTTGSIRMLAGTQLSFTGSTNPALQDSPQLLQALFDGATSFGRAGGGPAGSGNAGTQVLTGLTIGARSPGSENLQGFIAELIVYDRALTEQEIQQVATYLSDKWSVVWVAS
jgi:hypothetical protein